MRLTDQERAEALDILHAAGLEGADAETSLDTLARLTDPTSLTEWLDTTGAHLQSASLIEQNAHLAQHVGNDAVRAASALLHHHTRP